jgi:quercetin dioxygenase-like cupin family protein
MIRLVKRPTIVAAAGDKPKQIEEFVGRVNTGDARLSVARMRSPAGWREPGQRPEFLEVTTVLRGEVYVEHSQGTTIVRAGQTVVTEPGEWIRYSTPGADGAEYIAVCLPAFAPGIVHRDASPTTAPGFGTRPPQFIERSTTVPGGGNQPIRIDEFVGRVNSRDDRVSMARLVCPAGWIEPAQRPNFLEVTLVLSGQLLLAHDKGAAVVNGGQAIVTEAAARVQYATPADQSADYIAVCLPAFSMDLAQRESAYVSEARPVGGERM